MSKYGRSHGCASELLASSVGDVFSFLGLVLSEHSEVYEVDTVSVDTEVLRLDISVDEPLIMKGLQGSEHALTYLTKIQLLYWLLKIVHDTRFQKVHDYEVVLLASGGFVGESMLIVFGEELDTRV